MRGVLQGRRWSSAFSQNGFGAIHASRQEILRALGPTPLPEIAATRPTQEALHQIFPRNKTVPEAHLWRPFEPVPVLAAPAVARKAHAPKAMASAVMGHAAESELVLRPPQGEAVSPVLPRLRPKPAPSRRALAIAAATGAAQAGTRGYRMRPRHPGGSWRKAASVKAVPKHHGGKASGAV